MDQLIENFKQLITSKQQVNHLIAGELLGTTILWEQLPATLQRRFVQDILVPLLQSSQSTETLLQAWNWLKRDEDLLLYVLCDFEGDRIKIIFEENLTALTTCVTAELHHYFKDAITSLDLVDDGALKEWPPQLFEWTALKVLTLRLFHLKTLPQGLTQLPHLKRLELLHCGIEQLPSWSLPALEELLITSTYHLKAIPDVMEPWTNVKVLAIHESDVELGAWILNFPALEVLHLDYFKQLSDDIDHLRYLRTIHIEEEMVHAPSLGEVDEYEDFWDRIESYEERFLTITFHY